MSAYQYTQADRTPATDTIANEHGAMLEERKDLYKELSECEVGSEQWMNVTFDIMSLERQIKHYEDLAKEYEGQ